MWAVHSPQTPLLLKVTIVVTDRGRMVKELASQDLVWVMSPRGSPTLRTEQAPMTDSQESQLEVSRYNAFSLSLMGMLMPAAQDPLLIIQTPRGLC